MPVKQDDAEQSSGDEGRVPDLLALLFGWQTSPDAEALDYWPRRMHVKSAEQTMAASAFHLRGAPGKPSGLLLLFSRSQGLSLYNIYIYAHRPPLTDYALVTVYSWHVTRLRYCI